MFFIRDRVKRKEIVCDFAIAFDKELVGKDSRNQNGFFGKAIQNRYRIMGNPVIIIRANWYEYFLQGLTTWLCEKIRHKVQSMFYLFISKRQIC